MLDGFGPWNPFKEFKYIAIYRDVHAIVRHPIRHPRGPGPPGGAGQGLWSLHRLEVPRTHGPARHIFRVPWPERRREVHDDQTDDEPDPTLPRPRRTLRHRCPS